MSDDVLSVLLANTFDGIYRVDVRRRIVSWNPAAEAITGYAADEVIGRTCADNILRHVDAAGCDLCTDGCPLTAALCGGWSGEFRHYLHHKLGHRLPVMMRCVPLRDAGGAIVGAIEIFRSLAADDVRLKEIERLREASMTDHLTGIGNRRYGDIVLSNLFANDWTNPSAVGIALIDIDNFKAINDGYGHQIGDRMLQLVARTLRATLRPRDVLSRWGGEEFLAALPAIAADSLAAVLERMRALVESTWLDLGDLRLRVTVSVGAVLVYADEPLETVLGRADALLYRAKEEGRNRVIVDGSGVAPRVAAMMPSRPRRSHPGL
ncbi:Diguanylate cyclase with PAS/PAC sensor [uncultured Alphaproteobacteria bacterium]|uniref:diguanylate cyclase n=1 Tax=uncultured Alphaproteobacteria bacterium TaxID=91750 RepID=A0A212J540_9PROT|nr:Diguanylate cyclase with PAS/PAC sensor [uncultured Alphaproteobacteria bacterium]